MSKWFLATLRIGSFAMYYVVAYNKPDYGPVVGVLLIVLNVAAGASTVAASRFDRAASGADDPTTLNLHH
jgi:hypothetical protein